MLADEGYVAQDDADALAGAYRFLRTLEHRLQIVRDLQTHELPADPPARTTLARSLGLRDADALLAEYERQTKLVRGVHERLFYRPLLESFAGPSAPRPGMDRAATDELLAGLGFARRRVVRGAARLVEPSTRLGKVLAHVFPVMVPALALASTPMRRWSGSSGSSRRWGTGRLADALAADPGGTAARPCGRGELVRHRPAGGVSGADAASADGGPRVDAQAALVSVVARYASRELQPRETGAALAAVADRVVARRSRPRSPTCRSR